MQKLTLPSFILGLIKHHATATITRCGGTGSTLLTGQPNLYKNIFGKKRANLGVMPNKQMTFLGISSKCLQGSKVANWRCIGAWILRGCYTYKQFFHFKWCGAAKKTQQGLNRLEFPAGNLRGRTFSVDQGLIQNLAEGNLCTIHYHC